MTLYGLPLVVGRRVQYGSIDPVVSRELFIRHALVEGEWTTHHRFWADNAAGASSRWPRWRSGPAAATSAVDDETLFELYDARIPADVVSTRHFDRWWKDGPPADPGPAHLHPGDAHQRGGGRAGAGRGLSRRRSHLTQGLTLPLSYAFAPGAADDGVTVDVPLAVLDGVAAATSGESLAFTVPGLREELVTALLRTLPKQLRRGLVPIPDRVREVLPHIDPGEPLLPALERELRRATAVTIPPDAWAAGPGARPPAGHLPGARRPAAPAGRRQGPRRAQGAGGAEGAGEPGAGGLRPRAHRADRAGSSAPCPRTVEVQRGGARGHRVPALVDEGATVGVRVVPTQAEATRLTWRGVRRLLVLVAGSPARQIVKGLAPRTRLALQFNPDGEIPDLVDDCVDAAADELIAAAGGPPRDEAAFAALVPTARAELPPADRRDRAEGRGGAHPGPRGRGGDRRGAGTPGARGRRSPTCAGRWAALLHRGFVAATGRRRLPDVVRYLRAMAHRLEKLPANAARDELARLAGRRRDRRVRAAAARRCRRPARPTTRSPGSAGWSRSCGSACSPRSVGTPRPVSEQRIYKAIDQLSA